MLGLIEIQGLTVFYGNMEALRGVSLYVEQGEIVVLLGSNGAGKSTVLRAISGLVPIASGEIYYQGRRLNEYKANKIVGMGITHVPEGRQIFSDMTVAENIEMGAYSRKDQGAIESDLVKIIEHFPVLGERKKQAAGTLSGGEQQMLAIARALMSDPKLVLMDEPSLGLAPLIVKEISRIIIDINGRGVSIMLVEQNTAMALLMARRAYVLQTGTVIASGDAKEIGSRNDMKRVYLGEEIEKAHHSGK